MYSQLPVLFKEYQGRKLRIPDSNSGGCEFNSWSKDHLSCLKPFVVFISPVQIVTDSQIRPHALSVAFSPTYCSMSLYHSSYIIGANNRTSVQKQLHPDVLLSILIHHSYTILNVTANTLVSSLTQVDIHATNSIKHRPSREANSSSGSQAIARTLWNLEVHYRTDNRPLPVPILSRSNPVHASPSNFLKIHFNIILPTMPRSSKWSLSIRPPHQNTVCTSPPPYVLHTPPTSFFVGTPE